MATTAHASDNTGWTVMTEQDPGAALCHIRIVIRSGSASDPADFPGLAHFTARAMLRGTQTRPFQQLNDAIESLGATISVSVDQTQTVFNAAVLTPNLASFMDLLQDVLTNPAFDVVEMNLLQKILYGELTAALQDGQVAAQRALMQTAYAGTALQWPVEGTIASVSTITPQNAVSFFQSHYVRENMVIAITSPLSREDAAATLERNLDPIPHGMLDTTRLPAPTFKGHQAVIVDRKGLSTTPILIATSGIADNDPSALALEAGNFVFGEDFTSRLMQVLRAEHGWTYGAYSSFSQLMRPKSAPGLFSIYLFPSTEFFKDSVTTTLQMFEDYASRGVTSDEFTFAKSSMSNRYPFQFDSAEKRLVQDLRSPLTGRALLTPAQYTAQLNALDLATLNRTISVKTDTQDWLLAVVGDASVLQPILSDLSGVISVNVVQVTP